MVSNIEFSVWFFLMGLAIGVWMSRKKTNLKNENLILILFFVIGGSVVSLFFITRIIGFPPDSVYFIRVMDIFQALGTLSLGTVTVFLTQREYQERRKKEISNEVAAPLYLEIENIIENFLCKYDTVVDVNIGNYIDKWRNEIEDNYKEVIASDISSDIPKFYDDLVDFCRRFHNLYNANLPMFNRLFNELILKKVDKQFEIREDNSRHFSLEYITIYGEKKYAFFGKSLLLNFNLKDYLFNNDLDIIPDTFILHFDDLRQSRQEIEYPIEFFNIYLEEVENHLYRYVGVPDIRHVQSRLINKARELLEIIKPNIYGIKE